MISPEDRYRLNLRMATEIMKFGLTPSTVCGVRLPAFYIDKGNEIVGFDNSEWNPCTDLTQAAECREKMRQRGFSIMVSALPESSERREIAYRVEIGPGSAKWGRSLECAYAELPATICRVIGDALDAQKG